jgi:ElaB/YqjD/DUF883 family membrane-anchored ribosome-binding protein
MIDDTRDLAEQDPAAIRLQIDETRSSLTEKLEAIEEQVVDTVQNARDSMQETIDTVKDTVQETVSTVKETVKETVHAVKETFDLRLQVERHPWPMLGGSFLAGLVAGAVFGEVQHRRRMPIDRLTSHGEVPLRSSPPARPFAAEPPAAHEPGLLDRFRDEIDQLKGMAVGMALGVVRDVITDAVQERMPDMAEKVEDVMNRFTTKLGGQPVRGRVFPKDEQKGMATPS